jgi:hypothetical protein
MDGQQQKRVNEAAEQFAEAVRASFQAVSERGASAQQLNAELTQQFFDTVIGNLRTQAEDTRQMTQLAGRPAAASGGGHANNRAGVGGRLHGLHGLDVLLVAGGHTDSRARCQRDREGYQGPEEELEPNMTSST